MSAFILRRAVVVALALSVSTSAFAQGSGRPVTLVVPFAAGAANDVLARTLATEIKDDLGPVVVDNKPGADGSIGAQFVKRSAPDGRTLLVAPNQYAIAAALGSAQGYDFVKDFEPIVRTNTLAFFLVVNREALPATNVAEFIKIAKERGSKMSFGSAGEASPHRLATEMLKHATGIEPVHVPYKGMAQGIPDFLEGRIQFIITGLPAVASHLKSGKLAVLATTEPRRSAIRPAARRRICAPASRRTSRTSARSRRWRRSRWTSDSRGLLPDPDASRRESAASPVASPLRAPFAGVYAGLHLRAART